MKKFSFLALAAIGLLLGACSDKDAVVDNNSDGIMDGKAAGFFKVNINLPTNPVVSTRSWAEDGEITEGDPILNDGLGKEYAVKTCILMLFSGTSESNATLKQVVDINGTFAGVTDDPNQITTNYEKVVQLSSTLSGNIYALAVVNGKGNIEYASSTSVKVHEQGSETTMAEVSNCTISQLQAKLTKSGSVSANDFIYTDDTDNKDYFFMTNAVLSNEKGGVTKPATAAGNQHILAPVDKAYIYETEAKAQAGNAAVDIYVERGMAKVTIKSASLATTSLDGSALGTSVLKANATLTGWCLDITNKSSYIVRQVPSGNIWDLCSFSTSAATDKYRFVGGNPVDGAYGTNKAGYRTYWALDPNYSDDLTFDTNNQNATNFSYAIFADDAIQGIGDDNPLYCLENTFNVEHQDARYTTRAIIGVKLTAGDADFYLMGADRKTLYTEANVKTQVFQKLSESTMFTNWYDQATIGGGHTLVEGDITITWDKSTAGVIKVTSITIKNTAVVGDDNITITTSSPAELADVTGDNPVTGVISTINEKMVNVERFVGGVAYYPIRIKHFGDDLTPWNANGDAKEYLTAPKESGIDDIYPDDARRDANYLGRYGMVRNNWYELVIGDILKVGSAEPPVIPSHPDDDLEDNFIKARINILSWAKRPQSWNLK